MPDAFQSLIDRHRARMQILGDALDLDARRDDFSIKPKEEN
jgi:hypothetical protein